MFSKLKYFSLILFLVFLVILAAFPVAGSPVQAPTNFDAVHLYCMDCATATPVFLADQASGTGGGVVAEIRTLRTPNAQFFRGGGVKLTAPTAVATGVPALQINGQGLGKLLEVQDAGTPVFSINNGGSMSGQVLSYATTGQRQFCNTATITDTASYTATVTAVSTPVYTWCSLATITGDASHCGATHGTGAITVTVKNSAATPAANSAGAAVTWCVIGTPQ